MLLLAQHGFENLPRSRVKRDQNVASKRVNHLHGKRHVVFVRERHHIILAEDELVGGLLTRANVQHINKTCLVDGIK